MSSTPGALSIGAKVGSYEVIALLGSGGMGEVYRARDSKLSRDVALKVLPAAVASDPERLSRFRREAQVLAALNHPNIAQIYGLEDAGAVHALVMELVPGRTLEEIIASHAPRGLNIADVLPIARQIAEALETAHEQGIIHRDLKPANVKVRDDGTVKVLDFGLAKAIDTGASAQADPTNSPTLTAGSTQLGVVLGTAAYMAPEQARGRVVDRRADIWAFGVVLYEMLTSDRAFKGEDISETLASVLKDTPQFDALPSDLPPQLRRLIADCLVRDPRQRLRDIGDARLIIDKIISGKDEEVVASGISPVARPRSRFATLAPWGITVAALLVAAFVLWSSSHAPAEPPRVVTRSLQELKDLSGFIAISRDGTRAVFTDAGPGGYFLIRRDLSEFEGQRIPGSENALFPILSPDGQSVAYGAANESNLKKIPVSGGTAITLCQGAFAAGGSWGDDDTIVFSGSNGLFQVPSTGGTAQQLTTVDTAQGEGAHVRPQFLPGGRELLFTVTRAKVTETPQFAILDLKTRKYSVIAPGGDNGRYAPTGHLTYVRTGTLFALPFDLAHRSVIGLEAPVVPNVSSVGPAGTGDYAFSDNGVLIYSQVMFGSGSSLMWANREGTTTAMPGQIGREWGTGRLSLDGTRVVNGIHDEKGRTDIWAIDLLRGTPTRLTFEGNYDNPIWMPDGRTVVFGSLEPGAYGLYRTTVNGSGKVERLVATERRSIPFTATPDGNIVVFSEFVNETKSRLFVLPPAGPDGSRHSEPLHETSSDETQAELSPDGKWIAYRSSETRSNEIYVHAFPKGDKVRISTNGGNRPRWAKQGRELLYWDNVVGNPTLTSVMIQTAPAFQPSMPKPLFQLAVGTTWDVAPGGEKILVEFLAPPPGAGGNKSRIATVTNWFDELRLRAPAKKK